MGKMKKKNKGAGGTKKKSKMVKVRAGSFQAAAQEKVMNPFEIRVNRTKHDNLGKRCRHEKGVPGVSRGKAIEKRRETLLKEYKVRNKSNLMVDKRIGEKIKNMSEEEKIIQRSVMEKRRQYKQKSIFNLPSTEEILTHKGQMLMNIDRYEDPRDESDSEDERLNEEFVSDAHFAGGFLKVKSKVDGDEGNEMDEKSRKDIIAELILSSKQRKMEKAKEADETYELVTKLDQDFKSPEIRNLLTFVGGKSKNDPVPKKEDYDRLVREMHFETKTGLASNRLKTEGEIYDDELKKLQKLEKARLHRMKAQDPTVPVHRSADELADGYELDEDVPVLSYEKDGKLRKNETDEENEDVSDEYEDSQENLETGSAGSESENESDSDAFSDLFSEDEDDVDKSKKKNKEDIDETVLTYDTPTIEHDDVPYVLSLPKSYEGFKKLMQKYKALVRPNDKYTDRFKIVTERLVKYTHLADKNRLPELFIYIIRLIIESVDKLQTVDQNIQNIVDILTPQLHSILLSNPEKCIELMEAEECLKSFVCSKICKPSLTKILYYQICSRIFCVTDFCHRVLSPIKVDVLNTINSHSVKNYSTLLKVFALIDIANQLCEDSKRYCPEVIKFLVDILEAVAFPIEKLRLKRRRFEFLRINPLETQNLTWDESVPVLTESEDSVTESPVLTVLLRVFYLINNIALNQHKTRTFYNFIYKVLKAQELILKMPWANEDFHRRLFARKLPSSAIGVQEDAVDELPVSLIDRPKMLKLYEPMIEENFDGNKKRKLKRKGQSQEEARLGHKVKKEMKSAVREIIKDNAFLAKQQLKEQAKKDAERNKRVKELLGSLSNQEGDFRKLKKQK